MDMYVFSWTVNTIAVESYSFCIDFPSITLFRPIAVLCGIDSILWNFLDTQSECKECKGRIMLTKVMLLMMQQPNDKQCYGCSYY